jgi:hypothetical protein
MYNGRHLYDFIVPPTGSKKNAHHAWRIVVAGFLFIFIVSSHPVANESMTKHPFLKKDGSMVISIQEVREIPYLNEFFDRVGQAQRERSKDAK